MPGKRKRVIPYAKGFQLPSPDEIESALGCFPYDEDKPGRKENREASLLNTGGGGRTSLNSIRQIDNKVLFDNSSDCFKPLPPLLDSDSWLAKYKEDGQSMQKYVELVTMRSGHFKAIERATKSTIYIVPLIEETEKGSEWPSHGPDLKALTDLISAFFDRNVVILDSVLLKPRNSPSGDRIAWKTKGSCYNPAADIKGRVHPPTGHFQIHINDVLEKIIRPIQEEEGHGSMRFRDSFAVIGVTMVGLYTHDCELFQAGAADMSKKTVVLSFGRYDPRVKSSYYHWYDYGYLPSTSKLWKTNDGYFEDKKKRPPVTATPPESNNEAGAGAGAGSDIASLVKPVLLKRAAKLIIHEIGHLYGMEHCIHHSCNMNGTANLMEDFAAPSHWCGVCLRKLHYRLGFDVIKRYQKLQRIYESAGITEEADWISQRLSNIMDDVVVFVRSRRCASAAVPKEQRGQSVVDLSESDTPATEPDRNLPHVPPFFKRMAALRHMQKLREQCENSANATPDAPCPDNTSKFLVKCLGNDTAELE